MMEELATIELSGKTYSIKCDLIVLERIQEKYGGINSFEKEIITWEAEKDQEGQVVKNEKGETKVKGKFPNPTAVMDALYWMVCEGEEIVAEKDQRKPEKITREHMARQADMSLIQLARILHSEFLRCFSSKNSETTQN